MSHHSQRYSISSEAFCALAGLKDLAVDLPVTIDGTESPVRFIPGREKNGFQITETEGSVDIVYRRPVDAYRGLASLLAGLCPSGGSYERDCAFETLGVMVDVSRHAVLKVDAAKVLLRKLALMGINSVQLYMEDVYVLPDEPFFGYGRGAYTAEELRSIDAYGQLLGMEIVPCIQTLGHLQQIHQWPAYDEVKDVPGVLLADEEKTYVLIAKMLDFTASCFTTRRVHIGMDEAFGAGQGRYRDIHGEKNPFDVLCGHLKRVVGLCNERGLQPMMWSDMFFRFGSAARDYYDRDAVVPPEVVEKHIPQEVSMVYWDYYHEEQAFYEEWIERHCRMGKEPIFAAGAWTWGRLWACAERVSRTNVPGMQAARRKGLREAFVTIWGDDGAEYHPASMLASIQHFAELAFNENVDLEILERLFKVTCRESYAGFTEASELDIIPCVKGQEVPDANFGKWILWHDPILSFLAPQIPEDVHRHYGALALKLATVMQTEGSESLRFPALLAKALAGKCRLHHEVRVHYANRNVAAMQTLVDEALLPTLEAVKTLWTLHREVWKQWYKSFGWEVLESRYATVYARLCQLDEMLKAFVKDPQIRYEEFEFPLQRVYPEEFYPKLFLSHRRLVTTSCSF